MTGNSGKKNSIAAQSHGEEPQFDELSNDELEDVQGAGVYIKIGDIDGTRNSASKEDTQGLSILATNFKAK